MGRPACIERAQARELGLRFYTAAEACSVCFDDRRYVSNAQCVTCLINAGKNRYATLDEDQHEARRVRDHARYMRRAAEKARRVAEAISEHSDTEVDDSDFV